MDALKQNKPEYHVVMFSGGKDSTAVVLRMIELGWPLDEVISGDTTMEFPAMERHIERVRQVVEAAGIKFTMLKAKHDFEYYLLKYVPARRLNPANAGKTGKSWPDARLRWCTGFFKRDLIAPYLLNLKKEYTVIQYDGLAADEEYRLERKDNQGKRHPLVEWGWDEKTALKYCYQKGYDWEGLYEIFNRVSCWCCPLKPLSELRKLRKHFPELWQKLKDLDAQTYRDFKSQGWSVEKLEQRFNFEEEMDARGYSLKSKQFYKDLRRHCFEDVPLETILRERDNEAPRTEEEEVEAWMR